MSSSTQDLRAELGYLRDNVIEAISQGKTSILEDGLDTYEALVEAFIDVLRQFGSPYDRKQALAEIHSIEGGWSQVEWIRDDYREIADAAMASRNLSVLLPVLYFPVGVSGLAYSKGDYYIFAQFLNWLPYLYTEAVEQLASDDEPTDLLTDRDSLFNIVRDRLSRYPQELADYRIGHDIDQSDDATAIKGRGEFARWVFAVFNRLLKAAYDKRRTADFQHFASEFQELYRDEINDSAHLVPTQADTQEREEAEPSVSPDVARAMCYQSLSRLRQVIFVGLEAWLLRAYARQTLGYDQAQQLRGSLSLPSAIPDLWRLYLDARRDRYEDELEWTWWESREHRGRGAYAGMDFGMLVLRPILLRMLVTASSMTHDQINALQLELTPDLDYLVSKGSGPLIETLNDVADSGELRELATFDPGAAALLRERFVALAAEQEAREQAEVIEASVSSERVEELKRNVLKSWHESSYLRRLVQHRGKYELAGEPPPGVGSLSVHLWERKDIFVEGSRFSTHSWGTEWGRGLAQGEDELVVRQISSAVPSLSADAVDPAIATRCLDQAIHAIGVDDPFVLLVGSLRASRALAESGRFKYSHRGSFGEDREGEPNPSGYLDDIPVYEIHSNEMSLALVADLRQLGTWQQYRPNETPLSEYLEGVILFELETYDAAKARELLCEQPETFRFDPLATGGQRERSLEERITQVLQSVRVLVLEQLRFDVTNPDAGRVIRFTE